MFPLLESIKILNGKAQNLSYHQHRFEASYFKMYGKLTSIQLENLIQIPEDYRSGVVKLRLLYNETDCFCQYDDYKKRDIKTLQLIVADQLNYDLKWTNRKVFDDLKNKAHRADDILIIKNGRLTDTSFSNIVFYDGDKWISPKFPLLHGTARARLLNEQKIFVDDIFVDDLNKFQSFQLINALLDFDEKNSISIGQIFY